MRSALSAKIICVGIAIIMWIRIGIIVICVNIYFVVLPNFTTSKDVMYNLLITFQLYIDYDSSWDKFVAGYKKDNISANQLYQCWLHTKKISEFVNAYLNYYHPDLSLNDMIKYIENI